MQMRMQNENAMSTQTTKYSKNKKEKHIQQRRNKWLQATYNCNFRLIQSYFSRFWTHHRFICLFAFRMEYNEYR